MHGALDFICFLLLFFGAELSLVLPSEKGRRQANGDFVCLTDNHDDTTPSYDTTFTKFMIHGLPDILSREVDCVRECRISNGFSWLLVGSKSLASGGLGWRDAGTGLSTTDDWMEARSSESRTSPSEFSWMVAWVGHYKSESG